MAATVPRRRGGPRDAKGRTLQDYPRPTVAVDVAVLALEPAADGTMVLSVLELRRDEGGGWCLPGTILRPDERLVEAARRCLRDKAGVTGTHPRQLHVLDDPRRDDRGWVLSVGHVDAGPVERLAGRVEDSRLVAADAPGRLPYGQGEVVAAALEDLRTRYEAGPDPDGLLGETFTLRQLRLVHEAVAGYELQRDTFRRAVEPGLVTTGEVALGSRGRPAEIFARA